MKSVEIIGILMRPLTLQGTAALESRNSSVGRSSLAYYISTAFSNQTAPSSHFVLSNEKKKQRLQIYSNTFGTTGGPCVDLTVWLRYVIWWRGCCCWSSGLGGGWLEEQVVPTPRHPAVCSPARGNLLLTLLVVAVGCGPIHRLQLETRHNFCP